MAEDKKTDAEAVKWGVLSDRAGGRAGDDDRIIHSVSQLCHRDQSRDQFVWPRRSCRLAKISGDWPSFDFDKAHRN